MRSARRWLGMARPLLPDDLWREIAPLLPPPQPRLKGGRRPIENRAALTGILFVPPSGLPWEMLPAEMGCGSGMRCWRRLRDWQAAGVWARLHQVLLKRMHAAGEIDWGRASLDSASVPAKKGGLPLGPSPSEAPSIRRRTLTTNRFEPRRGSSAFGRRSGPGCGPGCGSVRSAARTRAAADSRRVRATRSRQDRDRIGHG